VTRPAAAVLARLACAALLLLAPLPADARMVLNRGTASDPDTLDPHVSGGNSASAIIYDLFLGLMTVDAKGEVVHGAAEKHTVSPDGLTYTFTLRPGLVWSDGKPVTAEDFVYSMRRVQNPETAGRYAQWFWAIKNAEAVNRKQAAPETMGVKALDARTVQFTLATPSPIFLEIMASFPAFAVPRQTVEKFGRAWTEAGTMVSNGAYVLKERVPQTRVTLVKNEKFYDAAAVKVDEVSYFPTENLGTVLNRFRAKELDVALNFPPDQIDFIRQNLSKELHIVPNLGIYYFVVNTTRPPFTDLRVRKALSLAIDRDGMVAKLFNTGVTPAYSFVPPAVPGYAPAKSGVAAIPAKDRAAEAKRLMAEAGFGPGKPLKMQLVFNTLEEDRKMAVALAAMWRPLGVEAELVNVEFRDLQRRVRTGDYDVARWAYFAAFADASAFLNLLRTGDPSNVSRFSDAEFDRLTGEANASGDPAKRNAAMQAAETVLLEQYPVIPIYHYAGRRLIQQNVKGWTDNVRNVNLTRYLSVER
jgi:oligopeptide transport system substrate-binding protein